MTSSATLDSGKIPHPSGPQQGHMPTVLVIDENRATLDTIGRALRGAGFSVALASTRPGRAETGRAARVRSRGCRPSTARRHGHRSAQAAPADARRSAGDRDGARLDRVGHRSGQARRGGLHRKAVLTTISSIQLARTYVPSTLGAARRRRAHDAMRVEPAGDPDHARHREPLCGDESAGQHSRARSRGLDRASVPRAQAAHRTDVRDAAAGARACAPPAVCCRPRRSA